MYRVGILDKPEDGTPRRLASRFTNLPAPMIRRPASPALVTNAARRVQMQDAHRAAARSLAESYRVYGDDGGGYAAHLRAALAGFVPTHARRCSVETLHAQAVAWARLALAAGARFNVWQKAADALAFSAAHDLASLCIPSKLAGINQDAAAALASRSLFSASFIGATRTGEGVAVGSAVLGRMQPKHAAWLAALPTARVAVTAVTGGDVATGRDGQTYRRAHGVNVAVEVGALALAFTAEAVEVAAEVAPAVEAAPVRETAAEMQARLAEWF